MSNPGCTIGIRNKDMSNEQEEAFMKELWMKVYIAEVGRVLYPYSAADDAVTKYKQSKTNGVFEIK